jgi:uncharacterized protein YndB with AHSA1/START domain
MKTEIEVSGKTLQLTRVFNAPRPLVFAWWTSAEKLEQWFGCKGMTSCHIEMDFRVGGSFRQTMQIEGVGEFSSSAVYEEIVEPERIVYVADFGMATTRVTVEFFEQGSQTRLVITHDGVPGEPFVKNVSQGTVEALEKLDELLSREVLTHQI